MKRYWVWLSLVFLLASCSKTNTPEDLNTQNAPRSVNLYPAQAKAGDVITANIYDIESSQIVYAHAMVGNKGAPLTASPITGSIKFKVPEGLDVGWQSVKIGVVGPSGDAYNYRDNHEYFEYIGTIKIMSAKRECTPTPTDKCPNHDWDVQAPQSSE